MKRKLQTAVWWLVEDIRRWWWDGLVNGLAASKLTPRPVRYAIYRLCGMQVQSPSILAGSFFLGPRIHIGRGTFVNYRCFFENNLAPIEIGENCSIAMEVMFCTGTHKLGGRAHRAGPAVGGAIRVQPGTWIGTRAVLLPGVTVGAGCVIAAGAVVTQDCAPHGLYAGVPARRIRNLD